MWPRRPQTYNPLVQATTASSILVLRVLYFRYLLKLLVFLFLGFLHFCLWH